MSKTHTQQQDHRPTDRPETPTLLFSGKRASEDSTRGPRRSVAEPARDVNQGLKADICSEGAAASFPAHRAKRKRIPEVDGQSEPCRSKPL